MRKCESYEVSNCFSIDVFLAKLKWFQMRVHCIFDQRNFLSVKAITNALVVICSFNLLMVMKIILAFTFILVSISSFTQLYVQVDAGTEFSYAIYQDHTLWGWGSNLNGQITFDDSSINAPVQTGTDSDWKQVSCGAFHTMAIKQNGTLWGWGFNLLGCLGLGDDINYNTPMQVGTDNDWLVVSAGQASTYAIKTDGTLWAWGWNQNGQLGNNTTENSLVPVQIGNGTTWKMVAPGGFHALALDESNHLWGWGMNEFGQLANGSNVNLLTPTLIDDQHEYLKISCGFEYSIMLRNDSTLWTTGFNGNGQLGTGNTTSSNQPIQIGLQNDWIDIEAGGGFAFAIDADHQLYGWGYNGAGQLGVGTMAQQNSPVLVDGDDEWLQISAAPGTISGNVVIGSHSLGLKQSNSHVCVTGSNYIGQLGNSTSSDISSWNCEVSVSLEEQFSNSERSIIVYPNPVQHEFRISLPQNSGQGIGMRITDAQGLLVYEGNFTERLALEFLSSGFYHLMVTFSTGEIIQTEFVVIK